MSGRVLAKTFRKFAACFKLSCCRESAACFKLSFAVLAAAALIAVAGCSSETPQTLTPPTLPPQTSFSLAAFPIQVSPEQTILITPEEPSVAAGAVMSRTGWLRVVDAVPLAAAEAQVEIVNESGGIGDLPISLEVIDVQSDMNEAYQGGLQMAEEQAQLVLASCDRDFVQPTLQETAGILTFIPCPVDQRWSMDNVFTFGLPAEAEGRALAAQVASTEADTAVVFSDRDSGYSQGVCSQFARSFAEDGGRVLQTVPVSYVSEASDFRGIVQQPALRQAEIIVICSVLPTGRHLYDAIRSEGITTLVVAGSLLDGQWLLENRRQGTLQVLSYGSVWGDDPAEEVNELVRRIRQNDSEIGLDGRAVAAADAVMAFVLAAEQVAPDSEGRRSFAALRRAVEGLQDVQLVSGLASMSASLHTLSARILRVIESANNVPPRTIAIVPAS